MDMLHMPMVWYFVDWRRGAGQSITAIFCLLVGFAMCYICRRQIMNDQDN